MEVIKGIPVSPGMVIGQAFVLDDVAEHIPYRAVAPTDVGRQLERLDAAIAGAVGDLDADRDRVSEKLGPEPAKIFEFHLGLLRDRSLIDPVKRRIETEHVTAEYALSEAFRRLADQFRNMENEVFKQKANDVLDLDRRVLGKLIGRSSDRLAGLEEPVIVIAHEITPSQAAALDTRHVIAVATDAGGRTSHTSIVAAALGIPVVVGCQRVSTHVDDGDTIVVDGKSGVVVIRPDEETIAQYRLQIGRIDVMRGQLAELADLEATTLDGTRILLMGNIEFPHEIDAMRRYGGDGVGLYRTEFLFLTNPTEPTEAQQFEAFREAVERIDGHPLTIRTLDLGADKYTQSRVEEPERNPFLGCRSIRYCLQNLKLFKTHLRAILRASAFGPMKIMFPLITTPMELRQARMILADVQEELEEEGVAFDREVPVGMMVEVPSAALMAPVFAKEVAFFSIGTNDLIQYTLAVDRGNERVASLYTGANPAVLQLIKAVIRAGKRKRVATSICGEIAGEITYTMLLVGLGLRTLSMVPSQIPHVKRIIRSVDLGMCERLARKVGSFDSERKIMNCLREELSRVFPDMDGGWSA
ncbi:MAG: phosphoenolpyruvate--protein phosphotransferase [Phycisphaerales bacterium]|nr:phosphoenolpyruvate--protein phosphotransferase [Phycisphaerales bacterium]